MNIKHFLGCLCLLTLTTAAKSQTTGTANPYPVTSDTLSFQGRKLDVTSFFDAFPYNSWSFTLSDDGSKLFFQRVGTGKNSRYQYIEADGKTTPLDGKEAIALDPAKCNVWTPNYNPADGRVYWMGDEDNKERFNIYRGSLTDPSIYERITDVPYVYEYGFNKDKTLLAYVGRMGQNEQRRDELIGLEWT